jgi:hypothetical protein
VFCDITGKLGDFDLLSEFPLEACKHYFTLAGLQAVTHTWYRSSTVCYRKEDQLFVHKVLVSQLFYRVVHEGASRVELFEPFFSTIGELLVKS